MFRFESKREQRRKRLEKMPLRDWATLQAPLDACPFFFTVAQDESGQQCRVRMDGEALRIKMREGEFRRVAFEWYLDQAESYPGYGKEFDRYFGLRTNDEDREYCDHWATKRNKAYYVFAVLSFVISVVALVFSYLALTTEN